MVDQPLALVAAIRGVLVVMALANVLLKPAAKTPFS